MNKFAIYGSGGCGRGVLPIVRGAMGGQSDIVFVEDNRSLWGRSVNQAQVCSFETALEEGRHFSIAIANGISRQQIADRIAKNGGKFFNVRDASTIVYDDVEIGSGSILCANVIITSNIKIGRQFHANIYSYVEHDCRIGDYVTFAPRVSCNGYVLIGDGAYIGAGAILRQGNSARPLIIGAGATIGMGAVVTKDVPPGVTVVGNPARILEKK